MLTIEDIKSGWKSPMTYYSQESMWDESAKGFSSMPIPTVSDNEFLRLVKEIHEVDPKGAALDVGCGAGQYSIALSDHFGKVVGVDFSGNMIESARRLASENGVGNVEFHRRDWKAMAADDPLLRGGYDLVFAHTTPAVSGADPFSLLVEVCRGTGLCSTPVRRRDGLLKDMWEYLGYDYDGMFDDSNTIRSFGLLWLRGLNPHMHYETGVEWDENRPYEKALEICRAEVSRRLGHKADIQERLEEFLLSAMDGDGIVKSITNTEIATVYWKASG